MLKGRRKTGIVEGRHLHSAIVLKFASEFRIPLGSVDDQERHCANTVLPEHALKCAIEQRAALPEAAGRHYY